MKFFNVKILKKKYFALFLRLMTLLIGHSVAQAGEKEWLWICKGDNWLVEVWVHPVENRVADLKFRNSDSMKWELAQETSGCLEETTDESGLYQTCLPSKVWESGYLIELQGNTPQLRFGTEILPRALSVTHARTANVYARSFSGEILVNESPLTCRYLPAGD